MTELKMLGAIDLFCGAGGLTCGLRRSGVDVLAGVDVDEKCRHAFEVNNGAEFLLEDVSQLSAAKLHELFDGTSIRILAGCAPCQPFSTYSHRYETVGTPRWGLLYHFARLVRAVRPEIVTMENVPSVSKHQVYHDFVATLEDLGYQVWNAVVDCRDHDLPQMRKRTVLMASLLGPIQISDQSALAHKTVRDAIYDLPPLENGQSDDKDRLHVAAKLSPLNLERMRVSKPGGTWRDWPEELVAACHRKSSGKTYPGVYARMEWDKPSPTLTTQFFGFGNGRFGHPEQDRAISLREGAILQGFPPSYSFLPGDEHVQFKTLGRLIGNAVPVALGETIGRSILQSLQLEGEDNHDQAKEPGRTLVA
ncbi:DNA cytosine methyltransferase [Ruegeria atlantica]|nr:DNA cytosine methyltransferase [Ruegeria atlantica]